MKRGREKISNETFSCAVFDVWLPADMFDMYLTRGVVLGNDKNASPGFQW